MEIQLQVFAGSRSSGPLVCHLPWSGSFSVPRNTSAVRGVSRAPRRIFSWELIPAAPSDDVSRLAFRRSAFGRDAQRPDVWSRLASVGYLWS